MNKVTKKCSMCGDIKPILSFHKRLASRDKRTASCKLCANEKRAKLRNKEKDRKLIESTRPLNQLENDLINEFLSRKND